MRDERERERERERLTDARREMAVGSVSSRRVQKAAIATGQAYPALERQQQDLGGTSRREAPNRHDAVALRPLPRQEAPRDASKLPAPAVDRRQPRATGRGQRRMSRAAPMREAWHALAAAAGCAARGRRGALRQRRWRGVAKLRGEARRRSGQASVRNGQWGVNVAGWLKTRVLTPRRTVPPQIYSSRDGDMSPSLAFCLSSLVFRK